jgi:uncharacterized protein (TIGR03437 family)
LYQLNVIIPANAPSGDTQLVITTEAGLSSQPVTISIR